MSTVSSIFGCRLAVAPYSFPLSPRGGGSPVRATPTLRVGSGGGGVGLVIESSSRPQKKATAHHRKTRPKKTQPWDVKRGPTVYPPLPQMPPEWTLVTDTEEAIATTVVAGESAESDSST